MSERGAPESPDEEGSDHRPPGGVPYAIPRHEGEVDRLDLQHYALLEAIGSNYLAPIDRPGMVLDAGAGTGQWGFDLCDQFSDTHVVGLDVVPGKPGRPPGYHALLANLLHDLPFLDHRFDFVHQRLLFAGVPVGAWPALVRELVRVTRPGGWIELVEAPPLEFDRVGPVMERFRRLAGAAAARVGIDATSDAYRSLDAWLRAAGGELVTRREIALPVGEWGGRVGSLMATDFRLVFSSLGHLFAAAGDLEPEEVTDLTRRLQQEFEDLQVSTSIAVVYGRKPG
jgi:SAM-dependent methyltransferase